MLDDMQTCLPDLKYADDTSIYETVGAGEMSRLQQAADEAVAWAHKNNMKHNASKTKELLIHFGKQKPNVPPITVEGEAIERVQVAKLIGVYLNDTLTWSDHIDSILKKANTRLYYLRELKRAGIPTQVILTTYLSLVRSITEYASPAWSSMLTEDQSNQLESVQRRALTIVLPDCSYACALQSLNLQTLKARRHELGLRLFRKMQSPSHKLHSLLPKRVTHNYALRKPVKLPLPRVRTVRCKNSFITWGLFNQF